MQLAWEMAQAKLSVERRVEARVNDQVMGPDHEAKLLLAEYERNYEAIAAAYRKGRAHFKAG